MKKISIIISTWAVLFYVSNVVNAQYTNLLNFGGTTNGSYTNT